MEIKDWFIVFATGLLVLSFFEIKRLKAVIVLETKKKLTPQITLELKPEELGLFIKNEWFFIARDITFKPLHIAISDFGFTKRFIIEIEGIEVLRPHERKQLSFKVYDEEHTFLREATEKFIPHLISPSFKVSILFRNVEGVQFSVLLSKKGKVFLAERVELLQEGLTLPSS